MTTFTALTTLEGRDSAYALGDAMERLKDMGYTLVGLDGEAPETLAEAAVALTTTPTAIVLGAEGPGLRDRTRTLCDRIVRIDPAGAFGSLNVSNAAAVGLFALSQGRSRAGAGDA